MFDTIGQKLKYFTDGSILLVVSMTDSIYCIIGYQSPIIYIYINLYIQVYVYVYVFNKYMYMYTMYLYMYMYT